MVLYAVVLIFSDTDYPLSMCWLTPLSLLYFLQVLERDMWKLVLLTVLLIVVKGTMHMYA